MSEFAILKGHGVVRVPDVLTWARWYETADRHVGDTHITDPTVRISTVFLGINHSYGGRSLWFETMIFGGPLTGYCKRCETWEEAVVQHEHAVGYARAGKLPERA